MKLYFLNRGRRSGKSNPSQGNEEGTSNAVSPPRVSRRELIIAGLYGALATPGIVVSCGSIRGSVADRDPHRLLVRFPSQYSAGTLYAMPLRHRRHAAREWRGPADHWDDLGPARGSIALPKDTMLWVAVSGYALVESDALAGVPPHALYRISLEPGVDAPDSDWFAGLARFTSLQELDLSNASSSPERFAFLGALPSVKVLRLPVPSGDGGLLRQNRQLAAMDFKRLDGEVSAYRRAPGNLQ